MVNVSDSLMLKANFKLKNRLVLAPVTTSSADEAGVVSLEDLAFFRKVTPGFGAVIVGSHAVSALGESFKGGWNIYDVDCYKLQRLKDLTATIKQAGSKAILQLYHAGRLATPDLIGYNQPVAPSRVPADRPFASFPRELEDGEIELIIDDFCEAVKIAIEANFDGVEIHGANTYLVQQFFSPHSNRRQDKWGGSRVKRMHFIKKLINRLNELIEINTNDNFILGYRFSPEEIEKPGITLSDTKVLLKELDTLPLDYFHVSLSSHDKLSQGGESIIDEIANLQLKTPMIWCGGIKQRATVDSLLSKVQLVSVCNAALIEPEWAAKILSNTLAIRERIPLEEFNQYELPTGVKNLIKSYPLLYISH